MKLSTFLQVVNADETIELLDREYNEIDTDSVDNILYKIKRKDIENKEIELVMTCCNDLVLSKTSPKITITIVIILK